jgi:hypothetical protein
MEYADSNTATPRKCNIWLKDLAKNFNLIDDIQSLSKCPNLRLPSRFFASIHGCQCILEPLIKQFVYAARGIISPFLRDCIWIIFLFYADYFVYSKTAGSNSTYFLRSPVLNVLFPRCSKISLISYSVAPFCFASLISVFVKSM